MNAIVLTILITNCLISLFGYRILFRSRYLFSDRFGFIVSITGGNIVSLVITNNLFYLFSNHFIVISFMNLIIGVAVGVTIGSLLNSQTLIAGIYSGGTGAVMGTMIGAVSLDPSICSLPTQIYNQQELVLFFGLFGLFLHLLTTLLLLYAMKV
ncbi:MULTISPECIES: hypothetical protein [Bacillaceae]|uniref:hypothetical protein n=1 Tax=Bacillaceae TaxID=186817 RepID=UPI000BFBB6E2|nr:MULTISPECIES: hypothetical protein [Bacillaceae]PGT87728.1 hypothetical protein COD11_06645 [Bacillus sp. AFS040349]UGB32166.1 hypothetical protein LPC09_06795 [Metabacillus sp. B2-18]